MRPLRRPSGTHFQWRTPDSEEYALLRQFPFPGIPGQPLFRWRRMPPVKGARQEKISGRPPKRCRARPPQRNLPKNPFTAPEPQQATGNILAPQNPLPTAGYASSAQPGLPRCRETGGISLTFPQCRLFWFKHYLQPLTLIMTDRRIVITGIGVIQPPGQ